jgi:hypothetical protein
MRGADIRSGLNQATGEWEQELVNPGKAKNQVRECRNGFVPVCSLLTALNGT